MYLGDCNGCGRCCQAWRGGVRYRCTNLLMHDVPGKPSATSCAVYAERRLGMPIVMLGEDGSAMPSACLSVYPRSTDAIPPECSYTFVPDKAVQIQPAWSFTYTPTL